MTFLIIAIIIYFILKNSSFKVYTGSSRQFTYDDIDVRILSLSAAVIKADGVVSASETLFVRQAFIKIYGQERAERAFTLIKSFEHKNSPLSVCSELRYSMSYDSRGSIISFLFQVASADGQISDAEVRMIASFAAHMGIAPQHFEHIYSVFSRMGGSHSEELDRKSPYEILEVEENASVDQIKQSYRILAKKYHPDRMVKYPEAERKIAQDKFVEIQNAYERLKKEKGF